MIIYRFSNGLVKSIELLWYFDKSRRTALNAISHPGAEYKLFYLLKIKSVKETRPNFNCETLHLLWLLVTNIKLKCIYWLIPEILNMFAHLIVVENTAG